MHTSMKIDLNDTSFTFILCYLLFSSQSNQLFISFIIINRHIYLSSYNFQTLKFYYMHKNLKTNKRLFLYLL